MDRVLILRRIEALLRTRAQHHGMTEKGGSAVNDTRISGGLADVRRNGRNGMNRGDEWNAENTVLSRNEEPAPPIWNRSSRTTCFFGMPVAVNGHTWLERRLGLQCATSRGWRDKHLLCRAWSPWIDARASAKVGAEDYQLIRDDLIRDSRMRNREMMAPAILSTLQDLWARLGREGPCRCACRRCGECSVVGACHGEGRTRRASPL
jgi:hypothetical protein